MSYIYAFEKLEVYKLGRTLNVLVYKISEKFPDIEKFGLTLQIRRASISVCSNISEGASKPSYKEQARFTEISYNSLMEVLNDLILANDLEFIRDDEVRNFRILIEELGNKLNAYRNYQLKKFRQTRKK